ncbi:MAG TPA: hypothetical protein VGS41_03095, partial [Chthonomonadales bacterium]|nr:hypothetical protein [Chthonomonadales bacterium]
MSSTAPNVQMISVALSQPDLAIEPGATAHVVVTMANRQEEQDRISLEVEGVDVEWYSIPVSAVNVPPGGQAEARINFRVARASENLAGSYPFLVRAQALETGAQAVAQGTLIVKPFSALQVEISPRRATATFFHPLNDFEVSVQNLGNVEETLDLYASDPEDGCAYEFDEEHVALKAGQSQLVLLAARPRISALIGGARLYGFTVSARSAVDGYVSADAHGQIEKHALISPLLGIFLLLLASAAGGWALFRPHPPLPIQIHSFRADPSKVMSGQQVTLTWDVTPTYRQLILSHRVGADGVRIVDSTLPSAAGHFEVTPAMPKTTYMLEARGGAGQKTVDRQLEVNVAPQPPPPAPVVTSFRADPPVIHQGDSVVLSWEGNAANGFILDPGNNQLGPLSRSLQVTPIATGDSEDVVYTLRPVGASFNPGKSKQVKIRVAPKDVSIAQVNLFSARPDMPYIGDAVKLRWKVSYAASVHIDADKGSSPGDVPRSGSYSIPVSDV